MKILIIDDEEHTVTTVRAFLSGLERAEISVAYNGKDGLDLMEKNHFDILILDFMMSGMSGLDVCKTMSEDENMKHVPVLLISALPVTSPELHELLEQFDQTHMIKGILEKPFNKDEIVEEVKKIAK
jgi:CheY-like chemotaxis protein